MNDQSAGCQVQLAELVGSQRGHQTRRHQPHSRAVKLHTGRHCFSSCGAPAPREAPVSCRQVPTDRNLHNPVSSIQCACLVPHTRLATEMLD